MKKLNLIGVVACAAILLSSPTVGHASILGSMLSSNSQDSLDELADSSAGWFARKSGGSYSKLTSGNLEIGDYVQGVIKIDAINSVDPLTKSTAIFAAYSFKIAAATDNGNGGWSAMQLETGGDVLTLINANDARTDKNENGLTDSDAAVAIMEKSTTANIAPTDFTDLGDFDSSWTTVLSAGFDTSAGAGDNLDDYVISARSIGGNQVDLRDLTALASLNSTYGNSATIADFEAAFLVQGKETNLQYQSLAVPGSNIEASANFYITNGTLKTSGSSDHMFTDAGEFYGKFHAIPEPSTIAIWAAIGLGGCGFVARRRMKARKA